MKLFRLLSLLDDEVVAEHSKIHLAIGDGKDDPLDLYFAGEFDEWQSRQSKRNFELQFVVSLISLRQPDSWLFVGVYESLGCKRTKGGDYQYQYQLERRQQSDQLEGRIVASFKRPGRQSYLLGERWRDELQIAEIRAKKLRVPEFPGYSWVSLSKRHLDIIVNESVESWRVALSHVAGVYLIADRKTGRLYVGSATSGEGIWSRWCSYSRTNHGGNKELKNLLDREGESYAENFQFGILEIADTHASVEDVLSRELRWKELLLTKEYGYNAN